MTPGVGATGTRRPSGRSAKNAAGLGNNVQFPSVSRLRAEASTEHTSPFCSQTVPRRAGRESTTGSESCRISAAKSPCHDASSKNSSNRRTYEESATLQLRQPGQVSRTCCHRARLRQDVLRLNHSSHSGMSSFTIIHEENASTYNLPRNAGWSSTQKCLTDRTVCDYTVAGVLHDARRVSTATKDRRAAIATYMAGTLKVRTPIGQNQSRCPACVSKIARFASYIAGNVAILKHGHVIRSRLALRFQGDSSRGGSEGGGGGGKVVVR